ncbi:NAD(P)/FAD-dependent oxidoreductase [Deferribacter autotrophicus]|uniref:NAD(P)/FAD-dependent oxidoreductase n=1 Tax=Deferribacter autotrophicus TaxID=500465 RepID=A0A5A8F3I0_9BACT|nr:NAD(P)/FAD-dependent oxidoreductase [Deferribacter autotrophicus]KAA0258076.1 NAD(P)/FAD-dependent oxidoreductase [Deferribacter autotrophicus]
MDNYFDVIVIGAGPAGISTAKQLSQKGKSVLVVDNNVANNYVQKGSVLSNSVLYYSYLYDMFINRIINFIDIKEKDVKVHVKKLRKSIDTIKNKLSKTFINELVENNISLKSGVAKFLNESSILIDDEVYEFDYVVIATGSTPKSLKLGSKINYLTLENFLNLESIPENITIIGGGYVGVEIAVIFKRFGAQVTIVEKEDKLLRDFDDFIVKKFEDALKKGGVNILKKVVPEKIERVGSKIIIFLNNGEKIETNETFVAIGREPNLANLDLEKAGIRVKDGRIKLNNYLQTSNKKVFVVGDATGFNMFVNWSYKSSEIVVDNILGAKRNYKKVTIPKIIYADPEIASIGITEQEAKEQKMNYEVIKYSFADIEKSAILGFSKGVIKIIYNKDDSKIVGAHVLGKGASELINIFGLMIQLKVGVEKIKTCIFNNPLFASILTDLSEAIRGKCCDS